MELIPLTIRGIPGSRSQAPPGKDFLLELRPTIDPFSFKLNTQSVKSYAANFLYFTLELGSDLLKKGFYVLDLIAVIRLRRKIGLRDESGDTA
jgi:hypothetical protein